MASIQVQVVRGHRYYRIVESRRINGKPRPVPVLYLGTADNIRRKLTEAPERPMRVRTYQHGDVASLKAAADRLRVVEIIDQHVAQRNRGPSVGATLLLAAINRAVRPSSKRGWARWARQTSLHRLFPGIKVEQMTSQFFWDQMDAVAVEALASIEDELAEAAIAELGIGLDTLFYDTTNFFTYIDSANDRSELARRGKSKQKRSDLRLLGLALLVSREGHLPLCSEVYEGNRPDCKVFPEAFARIRKRLAELSSEVQDVTIVYDKGNLSRANQSLVDGAGIGYVASVVASHHPDLAGIPRAEYRRLGGDGPLAEILTLRLRREIWGAERTVVLFVSNRLREGQIRGLGQQLDKRVAMLADWQNQLAKPRSGPRSREAAKEKIDTILDGQHIDRVLHVTYYPRRKGTARLTYHIDNEALQRLHNEVFGTRILITNRHEWSTEEIIRAYRGQSEVEAVFRQLKDTAHLALRPQFHWTDQKVQVHAFTCLLGLLLARAVEFRAREHGSCCSLSSLLDRLGTVRLAMLSYPSGPKGGRPRAEWAIDYPDEDTLSLYTWLVPASPPFVYTARPA